jgi:hypothetical protein
MLRQRLVGDYNSAVVRRAKAEPLPRPFKGSGRIRERSSDAWSPVEFLSDAGYDLAQRQFAFLAIIFRHSDE